MSLNCKICNSEMNIDIEPTTFSDKYIMCPNGCYEEVYRNNVIDIYVFEEPFFIKKDGLLNDAIIISSGIQKAIDYWKTNERYLLKILEGYKPVSHKPKTIKFYEQFGLGIINDKAIAKIRMP